MTGARLDLRLKPRAKSDRVSVRADGVLEAAVTSPPVDDRANRHLIELLAERLGLPKRSIAIIKGGRSRNKAVEIEGMTKEQVIFRLTSP